MLKELARSMNVEYVDLNRISVNKRAVPALTADVALKYKVFPFDMDENYLYLAMTNPDDIFTIDEIKVFTQKEIKPFLADESLIEKAICTYYRQREQDIRKADVAAQPRQTSAETYGVKEKRKPEEDAIKEKSPQEERINHEDIRKTEIFAAGDMDTESMIKKIILSGLKIENVVDVHIDTLNRNIIVTLSLYY